MLTKRTKVWWGPAAFQGFTALRGVSLVLLHHEDAAPWSWWMYCDCLWWLHLKTSKEAIQLLYQRGATIVGWQVAESVVGDMLDPPPHWPGVLFSGSSPQSSAGRQPWPLWCPSSGWLRQCCSLPKHQDLEAVFLSLSRPCTFLSPKVFWDKPRQTCPLWQSLCRTFCIPEQLMFTAPGFDVQKHPNLLTGRSPAANEWHLWARS